MAKPRFTRYWGTGVEIEFDGKQLPNSPKHKTSLTLAYDVPIAADWGSLELLTIMNYRSKKYVEHGNVEAYAVSEYTRWDLRANWQSPDSSVEGYRLCAECARPGRAAHVVAPRRHRQPLRHHCRAEGIRHSGQLATQLVRVTN